MAPVTDSRPADLPGLIPPHDRDAERAVLGAMLVSADTVPEVAELLQPDDFYLPEHRAVYQAILELFGTHSAIDVITVKAELERRGDLAVAGGLEALAEISADGPAAVGALDYARAVKEHALRRRMIGACLQTIREARGEGERAEEVLARAESTILNIGLTRAGSSAVPMRDYLQKVYEFIYRAGGQRQLMGLSTGIFELDDVLNGLQGSHLYIIAGRPSMGKTSLALRLLEHVTMELKVPAVLFSLEMPGTLITRVMMCAHCHVNLNQMQKGFITEADKQKLIAAGGRFAEAPLLIDDSSDLTIFELRARARRLKAQHGIGLVVVDYLQMLHAPDQESRQIEIAHISQQLKALSKELDVPVLALAQLNRAAEGREDKRPRLADLRESGGLEQDADAVMLLFREGVYNDNPDVANVCEVIVAKNRTGPTDTVQVTFLKEFMRFEPISFHYAGKRIQ
jgi:replicative DNA helicase